VRLLCHTVTGYEPFKEILDVTRFINFYGKEKRFILSINYKIISKFFVEPSTEIYEGQVIGENSRAMICVNVTKEKRNNLTFVLLEMMKSELFLNHFLTGNFRIHSKMNM
jgi:predicted membrane GTPase involved in stress response